jgi:hypothetical protein
MTLLKGILFMMLGILIGFLALIAAINFGLAGMIK